MRLKDLTSRDIKKVFWESAKSGYGSNKVEKIRIDELPGYKCILFKSGKFSVLDAYCVTPLSNKSLGTITIWLDNVPVWVMQYGGFYPKKVVPFLKLALQSTILNEKFIGGRGPSLFKHKDYPNLSYVNNPEVNDFTIFWGKEWITEDAQPLGYHYYNGIILI
ncbi:MAG: hypothetical protein KAR54_00875 [Candidatus Pacebacteria bacterium]|nr:hypothetical protein [Candidatus Paceibacterota bacterium]